MNSIIISDRGSFHIGGYRHTLEGLKSYEVCCNEGGAISLYNPNGNFEVGQMYVQYTILEKPKGKYPVLFFHGGGLTGVSWETTPDGRSGWDTLFLREGYNVFVSDSVERGRASWARYPEINPDPPIFRSYEAAWEAFRIGKKYGEIYKGQQFPVEAFDKFMKQVVPRWVSSREWTQNAYYNYIENMQKGCIIVVHSSGSIFALRSALKYPNIIKAVVLIEPVSSPCLNPEDISILKKIPHLFIWGDNQDTFYEPATIRNAYQVIFPKYYEELKLANGSIEWINLPEIGILGNSHMIMMDKNNDIIAKLIFKWLKEQGLSLT